MNKVEASKAETGDAAGKRLFVEDDLRSGARLTLPPQQAHRLRNVLRLRDGAPVILFNGRDGEWRAEIAFSGRRAAQAVLSQQCRPQSGGPDLWLLFALIKRQRLDLLIEKATELGAARLMPVVLRRATIERTGTDRMQTIAQSAAEQCERLDIPEIDPPRPLEDILADWPPDRRLLICAERQPVQPINTLLSAHAGDPVSPWAVMVGPEGGFAPDELDLFDQLPFVSPVSLGPRILRAETAAIAAVACWQAVLGDGRSNG